MGLISYIKGVYYDHRIEKADELLHNGKECEAEEIYKELLGSSTLPLINLQVYTMHSS